MLACWAAACSSFLGGLHSTAPHSLRIAWLDYLRCSCGIAAESTAATPPLGPYVLGLSLGNDALDTGASFTEIFTRVDSCAYRTLLGPEAYEFLITTTFSNSQREREA